MPKPIRDIVRATLVHEKMNDPAFRQKVIKEIGKKYEITRQKDRFKEPLPNGYRDHLVNVKLPNGMEAEIQLHRSPMFESKEKNHAVYEDHKKAKANGDKSAEKVAHLKLKRDFQEAHGKPTIVAVIDDHQALAMPQVKEFYKGTRAEFHGFSTIEEFKQAVSEGFEPEVTYQDYDLGKGQPTGVQDIPFVKAHSGRVVGFSDNKAHDKFMCAAGADDFIVKKHTL